MHFVRNDSFFKYRVPPDDFLAAHINPHPKPADKFMSHGLQNSY